MKKIAAALLAAVFLSGACAAAPVDASVATRVDVGFSPDGSGEALVLRSINAARQSVRLAAYSFTAPPVVRALIAAKRRGVDVAVVVDFKNNLQQDSSGKAKAALNLLVNAGIPTRTVASYPIQHSKYAVIDGAHVQTGSYNYSAAAARYNSENVLVVWNRPDLARSYLENWQTLYSQGQDYTSNY
ncbi:endonuclease [Burkholderia diffusa]|uniref:phospholipase D family nuclease n=1 Tax=Burkholderia diffusa TaxID=488732 RepID=UPI00075DAF90|nr:phospholipase D family protein [Burkholderia diffusa]KWF77601.1 endonuclease [Burkholderia diffusa]